MGLVSERAIHDVAGLPVLPCVSISTVCDGEHPENNCLGFWMYHNRKASELSKE